MNASIVDTATERKFFLDSPDDLRPDEEVTFLLNLHGGGSAGVWQRGYFPVHDYANAYRLVVAAPTAATAAPLRHWAAEADDEHLSNVVEAVAARFGTERIKAFWFVGHSQGGATCHRLLRTDYFGERVDGFLSLSGGRMGRAQVVEDFGPPRPPGEQIRFPTRDGRPPWLQPESPPEAEFSFVFATGEHEIVALPETSPWAERFGAGQRVRMPDVIDTEPGQVYDSRWEGRAKPSWGREPKPGTAQMFVYPNARGGRVIADIVRLDKGHTEGLEPRITEEIVKLIASAPGGKLARRDV